jgi:dATP/dGTP diphosphohydrolase
MLGYVNCPEHKMPDYPTIDGKPFPKFREYYKNSTLTDVTFTSFVALPTLVSVGLLDALKEVEAVLSWNATEKHSDCKWKRKSISYHDAKSIKHLSEAQCGNLNDHETGRRHRAHAICRLLMSLAHELKDCNENKV